MQSTTKVWLALISFVLIGGLIFLVVTQWNRPTHSASNKRASRNSEQDAATATATATGANSVEAQSPPLMMTVPAFSLTDQNGQSMGTDQLWGKAWIVNFMFTRCRATCPVQTARLATLQSKLKDQAAWKDIRFISITVDPQNDTPEVLRAYAREAGADEDHWKFLTGTREAIWQLSTQGFRLPAGEAPGNAEMAMTHSSKLVLVDPQRQVRGFYECSSDQEQLALHRDLMITLHERMLLHEDFLDPTWLESRRHDQLATRDQFHVVHDFSFSDRIRESGITFRHRIVDDAGRSFTTAHYDHGNGMAVADVDGDGWYDIYFVNQVGGNQLWRNLGEGRFENITDTAGVAVKDRISVTASFADTDNDGDADLYVTTVRGGNVLFENDGKGRFRDISADSGLGYVGHSSAALFFDYNRDGRLDLFLVNVGIYTTEKIVSVRNDTFSGPDRANYTYFSSNPDAFAAHLKPGRAEASILFENQGGNRFVDVSKERELVDGSWSGDASPLDVNDDNWLDLYIVNMQGHDEYYENVEGQRFVRKSRELFPATPWGSMGIKVFDFDNDGDMDIYITDMHTDMKKDLGPNHEKEKIPREAFEPSIFGTDGNHVWGNAFFRNLGNGKFEEASEDLNAENYWPWGLSVGDLNADGFDDVFITACMNFPYRYGVNSLLLNDRGKKFLDSEFILGIEPRHGRRVAIPWFELDSKHADQDHPMVKAMKSKGYVPDRIVAWGALGSRSSAIFDLDNDGDLDIVTNDFNSAPMVLVSNLAEKQAAVKFLKLKLIGSTSNRDGLGAKVTVHSSIRSLTKVNDGKSGYLSQSLILLYFGLGDANSVERIEVRWPSGKTQVVPGPIAINRVLEIKES